MAEHEHPIETTLPIDVLWDFAKEMDHWAPYLTGDPPHEKHGEGRFDLDARGQERAERH